MTRTERAACELALAVLVAPLNRYEREPGETHGDAADLTAACALSRAYNALRCANLIDLAQAVSWEGAPEDVARGSGRRHRVHRARAALALRALLRADAGLCGPPVCVRCGDRGEGGYDLHNARCRIGVCGHNGGRYGSRAIRPLWQIAAEHAHGAPQSAEGET